MTTTYTKYFRFALPDFRMGPWHDLLNEDIIRIDEILYGLDSTGGDALSAVDIVFDPTITGLPATNVQAALDYLWTYLKNVETNLNNVWAAARKVPVAFPFVGKPTANSTINVAISMPVTIPTNLAGTAIYAGVLATVPTEFSVNKISNNVLTKIGSIIIGGVSHTGCTLSGTGGSLNAGDVMQLASPAQDTTLADVGITILTLRV